MIKELNYTWTQDDMKKYGEDLISLKEDMKSIKNKFNFLSFIIKLAIIIVPLAICGIICLLAKVAGRAFGDDLEFIILLIFIVAIFVFSFIVSKKGKIFISLPLPKKFQQIRQSYVINSDSSDVNTNTDDGKTAVTFNWTKIQKIYNTENNILLFMARYNAIIIPKRIFSSEEEMNETWALIQECYNKSR